MNKYKGVTQAETDALMLICQEREELSIDLPEKLHDLEHFYILRAMNEHNNNQTRAAQALGIKRETLIHKLKKYDLI